MTETPVVKKITARWTIDESSTLQVPIEVLPPPNHPDEQPPGRSTDVVPWGRRVMRAAQWVREPDLWLRGITLDVLEARLWPQQGPAWTPAAALETPVLDGLDEMRWQLLLDPPKGRAGAEARRLRKALLHNDPFGAAPPLVPLHVLQTVRDQLAKERKHSAVMRALLEKERRETGGRLTKLEQKLAEIHKQWDELKEATKHHPELSALYGWWKAATDDTETPTNRIFDVLKRMFG